MTNRGRVYQPAMIRNLRKIYESNSEKAKAVTAEANKLLESAAGYSALARDAATLLAEADPEWTKAGDSSPADKRSRRLAGWHDALGFIELHPDLSISGYDSLSLHPLEGGEATPEFVAALEQYGFTISRTDSRIRAELWFGDYAVQLQAWAKVEEPPAENDTEPSPEPAGQRAEPETAAA